MSLQKEVARAPNFSAEEKSLLLDCVAPYLPIVRTTKVDYASKSERRRVWDIIVADFNDKTTSIERTAGSLQCCYQNLKRVIRKRDSIEKEDGFTTGDGQGIWKPDPIIDRLREFIHPTESTLQKEQDRDDLLRMVEVHDHEQGETSYNQENSLTEVGDDVDMSEHNYQANAAKNKSNRQRGMTAKLRDPKHASTRANLPIRFLRRAPQIQIVPSSALTDTSVGLVEHRLQLRKLHLERVKAEGRIKIKILETELKIKEALLEQERLKAAKLQKELELI